MSQWLPDYGKRTPQPSPTIPRSGAGTRPNTQAYPAAALLLICVYVTIRMLSGPKAPAAAGVTPGRQAPAFALADQDGRTHSLVDYRGRPIILAFYSQQSPAAVRELLSLKEQVRAFDASGVKVFAISNAARPAQKAVHDREKLPFPLLSDPGCRVAGQYDALSREHGIKNCTFVLDGTGRILLTMQEQEIQPENHGRQILNAAQCYFMPLMATVTAASAPMGTPVADFVLPRVDSGATESLYAGNTARATVVFFLSSKCPCSQGYSARMKALAKRYAARQVRFVGVDSSVDETASDAAAYQKRAGLPFPVLWDEGNVVADQMHARVTPEAFLMDGQGALRYHGRIDDDRTGEHVTAPNLANALDALLAGKQPPVTFAPGMGCAIFRKQNQPAPGSQPL